MSHITRQTSPLLFPPPAYAHVATSARLVITAGAVPLDAAGNLVGEGDIAAQAQQTIDNLIVQLALAGASPADILKTTVYVASSEPQDLYDVWDVVKVSPLAGAASTLLGVTVLGYPGQKVEIEAIAAVP